MKIWLNGAVCEADDARIDPRERGFLLADGVFETMGLRQGRLDCAEAHAERLARGCALLGLNAALGADDLRALARETAEANGLADAALRLTVARGAGPRGLDPDPDAEPTVLMSAAPLATAPAAPVSLASCSVQRDPSSPLSRVKSLSYTAQVLARMQARRAGAHEALMLSTDGALACAAAANVVMIKDGALLTPRVEDGALPGVTRAALLEACRGMGLEPLETRLETSDLMAADWAGISNALTGVAPVASVDGQPAPHNPEWTERLRRALAEARRS